MCYHYTVSVTTTFSSLGHTTSSIHIDKSCDTYLYVSNQRVDLFLQHECYHIDQLLKLGLNGARASQHTELLHKTRMGQWQAEFYHTIILENFIVKNVLWLTKTTKNKHMKYFKKEYFN